MTNNKELVLTAFETLFNKRDYEAAAKFWSPDYIQHSAHIPPGRDGLFNLVKSAPPELRYENHVVAVDGDYVLLHGRFTGNGRTRAWIAGDVVRVANGVLIEHWDTLQDEVTQEESKSGLPMFGDRFSAAQPELTGEATAIVAEGRSQMQLSLKEAQAIVELARAHAEKIGVPMNIAVVGGGGHLLAFARMDKSILGSIDIALKKAKTSVLFNNPSEALWEFCKPGGPAPATEGTNGGLIPYAGGVPIRDADGSLVGAVGVSGGMPAQDGEVARASLAGRK